MSSANSKSSNLPVHRVHLMPVDCCSVIFFISQSTIVMKKKADITHPWHTPEFTAKPRLEFCMQQVKIL